MAFDVEAAKADGYTDEQIQAFLKDESVARPDLAQDQSGAPVNPFVPRAEEAIGTAQYALGDAAMTAAKYGAVGGGVLYGANKVAQALRPAPAAPVAPTTFTGGANPAFDKALSQPAQQPGVVQRGIDMATKMREIAASKVAPVASAIAPAVRGATAVGAMAMPGNVGQNYPFPQSGPMRGQEINPATGQPWTPAELQQYNQAYR